MILYKYVCDWCGTETERMATVAERDKTQFCELCGAKMERTACNAVGIKVVSGQLSPSR